MKRIWLIILNCCLPIFTLQAQTMLETVNELDLDRYQGIWYEIARLPNGFEKDLNNVTATYLNQPNGKISVLNKGAKPDGKVKSAKGRAWRPNKDRPGRLKVSFFWPFSGDYYVLKLDADYQYALVGSPSRKYLWLLARESEIPASVYQEYIDYAEFQGFKINNLLKVEHSN